MTFWTALLNIDLYPVISKVACRLSLHVLLLKHMLSHLDRDWEDSMRNGTCNTMLPLAVLALFFRFCTFINSLFDPHLESHAKVSEQPTPQLRTE